MSRYMTLEESSLPAGTPLDPTLLIPTIKGDITEAQFQAMVRLYVGEPNWKFQNRNGFTNPGNSKVSWLDSYANALQYSGPPSVVPLEKDQYRGGYWTPERLKAAGVPYSPLGDLASREFAPPIISSPPVRDRGGAAAPPGMAMPTTMGTVTHTAAASGAIMQTQKRAPNAIKALFDKMAAEGALAQHPDYRGLSDVDAWAKFQTDARYTTYKVAAPTVVKAGAAPADDWASIERSFAIAQQELGLTDAQMAQAIQELADYYNAGGV